MANCVQYPGPGCVVEFLQGNAPQIAWVLEEQNGKLRLLLANRREMPLPVNRLLPWAGPQYSAGKSREEITALLNSHKEKREALQERIQPEEIWEMAQGELEKASVVWLAELAFQNPDVDSVAACGHALLACKSHFRFQPPEFEIYSTAHVEARRQAEEALRERETLVGGGAAWFHMLWDARMARKPSPDQKFAPPEPVRSRLERMLRARILNSAEREDEALWKQVSKGLPDDPYVPLLLAMAWGLVPEHYNYWLARADYAPGDDWSGEHTEEIRALLAKLSAAERPALEERFISMDSASTRDIDDAFRIEALPDGGWKLDIALACPALGWPFGSALDQAVSGRATSLYLPEGNHHMMPCCLGEEALSLHAGVSRPALIVRCVVGKDGVIGDVRPEAAWVNLAANLRFGDCQAVLDACEDPNPATPWADSLKEALRMAETRQRFRVESGAVILERPEADFYLLGEGAETEVFLKESPPSPQAQFLVSEIMILANAALAAWALERDLPLLFRTQDVTVPPEFAGVWTRPPDIARVVKALAPATLELTPRPHAGMGLSAYITVTSPLRRYADLINEAQILHVLTQSRPSWTRDELALVLAALNPHLEAAGQVQRFRSRYWKLLYIRQQAQKGGDACIWEATVSEENSAFVSLSLEREQLLVRGKRAMFGDKVAPGQKYRLRLGKIDPLRGEYSIMAVQEY